MYQKLKLVNMNTHYFYYPLSLFLQQETISNRNSIVFWASVPHIWVDQYGVEPEMSCFRQITDAGISVDAIVARPYNYTLFMKEGSALARHSMAYYKNMIDLAGSWKVRLLCLELWGALRDMDRDDAIQNCSNALKELCQYAKQLGVSLAVGNVSHQNSALMNSLEEVQCLLQGVNCDNLKAVLNYGVSWLAGERLEDWMKAFGDRLALIYLSGARNGGSGYPLSQGCCPIQKILETLSKKNFRGLAVLRMDQDICRQDPMWADQENTNYLKRILN